MLNFQSKDITFNFTTLSSRNASVYACGNSRNNEGNDMFTARRPRLPTYPGKHVPSWNETCMTSCSFLCIEYEDKKW